MQVAVLPEDEDLRLQDLYSYDLLDTEAEKEYDDLVQLAAQICNCPMSLITLVDADRQWFKAKIGLDDTETSRDVAFCAHTILSDDTFVVENAKEDERFWDNPLVDGDLNIRFYAGVPIVSPMGHRLGSMCVIDKKPATLTDTQRTALSILSRQVTKLIELRAKNKLLRKRATELLELKNTTLQAAIKEKDNSDHAIAYRLHESIAQKIAAVRLYMDMTEAKTAGTKRHLEKGKSIINEVLEEVRRLSNSILPSTINSAPIKNLLHDFVNYSKTIYSFEIEVLLSGSDTELSFENSIACIRIIEKWLEMLAQKRNVSQVLISFRLDEKIHLKITDDSLDAESKEMEECIIRSMVDSRAQIAGGTASYISHDKYDNVLSVVI
ncbi:MAG: GAF domain-containing protein [Chitinophagaceae bacterium]